MPIPPLLPAVGMVGSNGMGNGMGNGMAPAQIHQLAQVQGGHTREVGQVCRRSFARSSCTCSLLRPLFPHHPLDSHPHPLSRRLWGRCPRPTRTLKLLLAPHILAPPPPPPLLQAMGQMPMPNGQPVQNVAAASQVMDAQQLAALNSQLPSECVGVDE